MRMTVMKQFTVTAAVGACMLITDTAVIIMVITAIMVILAGMVITAIVVIKAVIVTVTADVNRNRNNTMGMMMRTSWTPPCTPTTTAGFTPESVDLVQVVLRRVLNKMWLAKIPDGNQHAGNCLPACCCAVVDDHHFHRCV